MAYELNCVLLNSYVEALTLTVTTFGKRAFKEILIKQSHKSRALIQYWP